MLISALLAAIEADLTSLLTVFSLDRFTMVAQFASQVDGAVNTSMYWFLVAVARFVFIARLLFLAYGPVIVLV